MEILDNEKHVTCADYPCKHNSHRYNKVFDDYCDITNKPIPDDIETTGCKYFELAQTCLDCKHAKRTVYETGTIDDIEYRCPFQDNKLIYDDINPMVCHYDDVPPCNIDKFVLDM